jgi:uncharacterized protein (TIGR02117 family)
MNRACPIIFFATLVFWLSGPTQALARTVYLVNIGWHVGIALPVDSALRRAMPEAAAFPEADFIEIGWGDQDFYRSDDPGNMMALKAALVPTNAVVHLYGFSRSVAERFSRSEIVEITLSDQEFAGLFGHIHASFERAGPDGTSEPVGPGLYGASSIFYKATGEFHLMRTCNTWVAEALAAAGLEINPEGIITADAVMEAARAAVVRR